MQQGLCQVVFLAIIAITEGSKFFIVTNKAELDRSSNEVLYKYAITSQVATLGTIGVTKNGKCVENSRKRNLVRESDSLNFGCYLTVRSHRKKRRARFGVYEWTATVDGQPKTLNSFVKPDASPLETNGVYTITVYPDPADETMLSKPLRFGVAPHPRNCELIWDKGSKTRVNTGRTLRLTRVDGAAGVYSIHRGDRKKRGWSVQIEVIVSDCPEGTYTSDPNNRCGANCPPCQNGGVCDSEGNCRCPPFFRGTTCSATDAWIQRPGTNDFYYIGKDDMSWTDAQATCQNLGGDLVSITSAEENQFIVGLLEFFPDISGATLISIGLTYAPLASTGTWADGTELDYTNWDLTGTFPLAFAPFTATAISPFGSNIGTWRNLQTFLENPFICERKRVNDPLIIETENVITCGQLPKGNRQCKGYHVCHGDLYGCSCASGWRGNACDKECPTGFYGVGCTMRCVEDAGCPDKRCDKFTGRCHGF